MIRECVSISHTFKIFIFSINIRSLNHINIAEHDESYIYTWNFKIYRYLTVIKLN